LEGIWRLLSVVEVLGAIMLRDFLVELARSMEGKWDNQGAMMQRRM
jgi:hypothetical protein